MITLTLTFGIIQNFQKSPIPQTKNCEVIYTRGILQAAVLEDYTIWPQSNF